ncbi:hypothetical protein [Streptomyces sp. AA1529]|uniref:hypothetical protein n=1 Tax=Streptomyces sp. AA1529 TaxID=1203257 RepID=UPI001319DEC9|nr:hypothetical protein [Streptomyces sp. AA1529]
MAHSEGAVAPPSSSYPSYPSSQLASQQARSPRKSAEIPDFARPLIDQIATADVHVRWGLRENEWFQIHALIKKCGIPAMASAAVKAAKRTDVESARYFLPGWRELPEQPAPGTERPPLRAVSGGYEPWRNPTNQDDYDEDL